MCAHEVPERRSAGARAEGVFTWFGGGHWRELDERHERSTHAVAGAVVVFGALLAWLIASLAVGESCSLPIAAVAALTLVFALLVGTVIRGTASDPNRGWPTVAGRAVVAMAIGVVVGELAALVMFASAIDRRLDQRALHDADSVPAVAQAAADLRQTREVRASLDNAVGQAREHLDAALVVARCEYHPTPGCPQTRITGIPGRGPETRTANELLADAQRELDNALAARDRRAPELDATAARGEQLLADARRSVVADAGSGLAARWVAMNELTLSNGVAGVGAMALRLLNVAFFVLLYLLPLVLRLWRGETTHDRHTTARAARERAELEADTAVAIKRAEVRRAAEFMWAEHQLTQTRLAIEAQAEIDREQQRRRVVEALEGPVRASSQRTYEPVEEELYLPIAAEAEAASRAVAELPAGTTDARPDMPKNLPAQIEPERAVEPVEQHGTPAIPSLPDATKAAARWIRPLVPPFVARIIDNTTAPLRSARQVFEEVEEIAFSFKRTHKVTVNSESSDAGEKPSPASAAGASAVGANRIESVRGDHHDGDDSHVVAHEEYPPLRQSAETDRAGLPEGSTGRDTHRALAGREEPAELPSPQGPRQLPPAE